MSEIKVTVSNYGRKYLYMRYKDPLTGKNIAKSTGTANMKEAVKIAAKWEHDLREGRYKPASKITWTEFRERYEDERVPALAPHTGEKIATVFNHVEELLGIDRLAKLTTPAISTFQRKLRDDRKLSEASIKGILAHLKAALRWAKRMKLLNEVPEIEMPTRAKGGKMMKGRGITTEEFERILSKLPGFFKTTEADLQDPLSKLARFHWFLNGLWESGLRLSESIDLSWDEPGHIQVDLAGEFAMFVIPGDRQKSGEDQLLPIAPEFAERLATVPIEERTGRVFKIDDCTPGRKANLLAVSRVVCALGKLAAVVVNQKPLKYASAHDLRRSFGDRWSVKVMPVILQSMMRHADITTTLRYYVTANGQKAAAEIHAAFKRHANSQTSTSCNTSPEAANQQQGDRPQTH